MKRPCCEDSLEVDEFSNRRPCRSHPSPDILELECSKHVAAVSIHESWRRGVLVALQNILTPRGRRSPETPLWFVQRIVLL